MKKSVIAFRKVEDDPALKNSHLKRTAFAQYFSLVNDMQQYEKDNFNKFQNEATFVVNNCLNRHILKLEFSEELTEAYVPKKKRAKSPSAAKAIRRQSFFGTRAAASSGKFSAVATAIKWLATKPGTEDAHLIMAEKFLETASQPSLPGRKDKAVDDFKVAQANCKLLLQK